LNFVNWAAKKTKVVKMPSVAVSYFDIAQMEGIILHPSVKTVK